MFPRHACVRMVFAAGLGVLAIAGTSARSQPAPPDPALFFQATSADPAVADAALARIAPAWRDDYTPMIVDLARFLPVASRAPADSPLPAIRARLIRFLEARTGQRFGDDLNRWREWMWARPYAPHPDYMAFKAAVYRGAVEPRMGDFLTGRSLIRLDEIDWGGVKVNGIPPLDSPRTVGAADAGWLRDSHVVFGLVVNGEARAYPRRILAWHELARDELGGVPLTVVYCTLCGTVIPYRSTVGGVQRTFGTSGLLYRSNKLMFDEETGSLWSTLDGAPVVGPLVGQDLRLAVEPVVTTTWGEWRTAHPDTTVVSLETGFDRDYAEGAAYRDYFATDDLMFRVSRVDRRLDNKAEVLGLLLPAAGGGRQAVALSVAFLDRQRIYHGAWEGQSLVVLTSPAGANRVYDAGPIRFVRWEAEDRVVDTANQAWTVTEEALVGPARRRLPRRPAFRAFWFGWFAQFPETLLVK
ncbi:MAG: DUF3179 domain-containing protein [Vicinamibacterales bacterium]